MLIFAVYCLTIRRKGYLKRYLEVSGSFERNPLNREKKGNAIYEKGKAEIHILADRWSSGTDIPELGIDGGRTGRYVIQ